MSEDLLPLCALPVYDTDPNKDTVFINHGWAVSVQRHQPFFTAPLLPVDKNVERRLKKLLLDQGPFDVCRIVRGIQGVGFFGIRERRLV